MPDTDLSAALDGIRARIAKVTDGLDFMPDGEPWPVEDGTRLLAAVDAVLAKHQPGRFALLGALCADSRELLRPEGASG